MKAKSAPRAAAKVAPLCQGDLPPVARSSRHRMPAKKGRERSTGWRERTARPKPRPTSQPRCLPRVSWMASIRPSTATTCIMAQVLPLWPL
ncbi:hypothetical protein D3C87_1548230 [compost metagenome]